MSISPQPGTSNGNTNDRLSRARGKNVPFTAPLSTPKRRMSHSGTGRDQERGPGHQHHLPEDQLQHHHHHHSEEAVQHLPPRPARHGGGAGTINVAWPTAKQPGGLPFSGPGGRSGHQGAEGDEGGEDQEQPPHHHLLTFCFLPFFPSVEE